MKPIIRWLRRWFTARPTPAAPAPLLWTPPPPPVLTEAERTAAGDAAVGGSETGSSFRQALFFKDRCHLNLHDTMIWNKGGFSAVGALATRYAPVFEYMFVLTKGKVRTFNPIKDRPNIHGGKKITGTVREADGTTKPMTSVGKTLAMHGQRFNIWEQAPLKSNKAANHPAPFPEPLIYDHIISWSNPGDLVLDPFGGSGTTAVAAERADRRWTLIERDAEYFADAVDRISGACPTPQANALLLWALVA